ncbi:MAG: penicillin-binding protein 2 [Calditrichaeota bacterium]|nr:penicillin-binding protein 2 [Calditrichota bacterium]
MKKYVLYGTLTAIFLILALQFFNLQISQSSLYTEKSLENSVKMVTQFPVRGNIYDHDGRLIVDNRPAFSLYLIPVETTERTIQIVSDLIDIPAAEIRKELRKAGRFQPVKVMRQVDIEKLTWIQENITDLPGIEWKSEPKRHYIRDSGLAHLLGTLGEIDEHELDAYPQLEPGDIVGKKALERTFDDEIRGSKGYRFVNVDAAGRVVGQVTNNKTIRPEPGKHLYLTIDFRLQAYADSLMEGKRGALIAMNTRTGGILTLLSKPDYDVSKLSGVISSEIWDHLLNDPHHPLYDRVCQSGYPPGSTYKLVAAIAALNEGIISPYRKMNCPGYFVIGRKTVRCWKAEGHGTLDLEGAIKNSCNVYFYQLGLLIGLDAWNKYSKLFHFGQRTGIELTNENPGLVPSTSYYNRVYGEGKWTKGMLANLAIGQGEILVTPLQMTQFVSILANRGILHKPHLGYKLVDPLTGREEELPAESTKIEGIRSSVYDLILEGMREVVDGGTGGLSRLYGISSAGKTGTAQNPHGKDHAWFIGYAPFENPEIAICVLVENGGSGGGVSAPIAGAYLKKYFYYKGEYDYELERKILAAIAARRDSLKALNDSLQTLVIDSTAQN